MGKREWACLFMILVITGLYSLKYYNKKERTQPALQTKIKQASTLCGFQVDSITSGSIKGYYFAEPCGLSFDMGDTLPATIEDIRNAINWQLAEDTRTGSNVVLCPYMFNK
jgi:hypothetical protein